MVSVEPQGDSLIFELQGLHKLWAFRSRLEIPREHVRGARRGIGDARGWKGWRAPGTYIPGVITAGTYYVGGRRVFWDVCNADNAISVDLVDEKFDRLVVEVAEPERSLALIAPDEADCPDSSASPTTPS